MKKKIITLITTLSMLCLVACSNENNENNTTNVGAGNNNEVATGNVADTPTDKPKAEVTPEPTAEAGSTEKPVSDVTDGPEAIATEEPVEIKEPTGNPVVVYEGIDMGSDLPGEEWVETFVGIIEEPKLVVFSDETGRKEIFENDSIIKFDPDTDRIGIYLPEGYTFIREVVVGITQAEKGYLRDYLYYFELKPEETRSQGPQLSALYVEYDGEKIEIPFVFVPE